MESVGGKMLLDKETQEIAEQIMKQMINIIMGAVRKEIRETMVKEDGMVNGFTLLKTLKELEKELDMLNVEVDDGRS